MHKTPKKTLKVENFLKIFLYQKQQIVNKKKMYFFFAILGQFPMSNHPLYKLLSTIIIIFVVQISIVLLYHTLFFIFFIEDLNGERELFLYILLHI